MTSMRDIVFTLPSLNFKGGQDDQTVVVDDKTEYLDKYDPLVFCRTCANMDTCLVPIFKEEGLNYNLNKKIEKYLPIRVSQEDDLPVHLCYHCASTLVAWDTLIVGCLEAEKKLHLLKNSCKSRQSKEIVETNESLPNEIIDSDDEPLISKKINRIDADSEKIVQQMETMEGGEDYQTQEDVKASELERRKTNKRGRKICFRDIVSESIEKGKGVKERIQCPKCGKHVLHSMKRHLSIYCRRGKEKSVSRSTSNKCLSCEKVFNNIFPLLDHLYTHVNAELANSEKESNYSVCRICQETYKKTNDLVRHVEGHVIYKADNLVVGGEGSAENRKKRKDGLEEERWKTTCEICGKIMSRKYTMKRHMATHMEERKFTCHRCGKQYAQESGLQRHMSIVHEGVRKYKCPICSSIFSSNEDLKSHQSTHTDPRPFQCDQCGRTFMSQKHLYHHRKYHHTINGMRELCRICNKYFSSPSVLKRHHKVVHLGLKEYQCQVCSAQLTTKHYLREHLKLHSDERPEVCSFCGKTFQMTGNLRQHMKTHMGKTQICDVCGKGFTRRCHLLIHMGSHRGLENPRCGRCHKVFLIKDDLEKHIKRDRCLDN